MSTSFPCPMALVFKSLHCVDSDLRYFKKKNDLLARFDGLVGVYGRGVEPCLAKLWRCTMGGVSIYLVATRTLARLDGEDCVPRPYD